MSARYDSQTAGKMAEKTAKKMEEMASVPIHHEVRSIVRAPHDLRTYQQLGRWIEDNLYTITSVRMKGFEAAFWEHCEQYKAAMEEARAAQRSRHNIPVPTGPRSNWRQPTRPHDPQLNIANKHQGPGAPISGRNSQGSGIRGGSSVHEGQMAEAPAFTNEVRQDRGRDRLAGPGSQSNPWATSSQGAPARGEGITLRGRGIGGQGTHIQGGGNSSFGWRRTPKQDERTFSSFDRQMAARGAEAKVEEAASTDDKVESHDEYKDVVDTGKMPAAEVNLIDLS